MSPKDLDNLKELLDMLKRGSYSLEEMDERDPEVRSLIRAIEYFESTYPKRK